MAFTWANVQGFQSPAESTAQHEEQMAAESADLGEPKLIDRIARAFEFRAKAVKEQQNQERQKLKDAGFIIAEPQLNSQVSPPREAPQTWGLIMLMLLGFGLYFLSR